MGRTNTAFFLKFYSMSTLAFSPALRGYVLPRTLNGAPWRRARMIHERRQHRRYVINRIAKFQTDSGALPRDCMITDISKQGARLFADGVEVPDQFHLLISGGKNDIAGGSRRECRVVWRLGGEIGVTFIGPPPRDWHV
jgi:hypothetical protein